MSISLIIPAYNEARRLPPFLDSITAFAKDNPAIIGEILVVDDGSSDATATVVRMRQASLSSLKLLQHERNRGKGAAVRTGMMAAAGDWLIFIDADGATPINELPRMLEALKAGPVAVGNRWMQGSRAARHSRLRQLSGWLYRTYMRLWGLGDVDTMCGFKGFTRPVARELFADLRTNGWLFDAEIAYRARRRGYRIINFPILWTSQDGSKLTSITLVRSGLALLPLLAKVKRQESTRRKR